MGITPVNDISIENNVFFLNYINDNYLITSAVQLICHEVKSEYVNREYQFPDTTVLEWSTKLIFLHTGWGIKS